MLLALIGSVFGTQPGFPTFGWTVRCIIGSCLLGHIALGFKTLCFQRSSPAPYLASIPVACYSISVFCGVLLLHVATALREEDEGLFLLSVSDVPVFHMRWN